MNANRVVKGQSLGSGTGQEFGMINMNQAIQFEILNEKIAKLQNQIAIQGAAKTRSETH